MTIAVNGSCEVCINDRRFSFNQFKNTPNVFLPLLTDIFQRRTLVQKDNEDYTAYLTRLFYLLYYKRGFGIRNNTNSNLATIAQAPSINADLAILNSLGINVVKHNKKTSHIVFKSSGHEYKAYNDALEKIITALKNKHNINRTSKDIKFGVELEFLVDRSERFDNEILFDLLMSHLVGEDRYVNIGHYNHNDGKAWILGSDGSVRGRGKASYELTSPILDYNSQHDLDELKNVLDLVINTFHGKINKTCGTHIHISFDSGETSKDLCEYFATAYNKSEASLFDKLVPVSRQADNNNYCQSCSADHINSRYRKLNLTHVTPGDSMHLEFRQLDGTLDFDKIMAWIKVQKYFIETAMYNVNNKPIKLNLADLICDSEIFDEKDIEQLSKMSSIVA